MGLGLGLALGLALGLGSGLGLGLGFGLGLGSGLGLGLESGLGLGLTLPLPHGEQRAEYGQRAGGVMEEEHAPQYDGHLGDGTEHHERGGRDEALQPQAAIGDGAADLGEG